MQASPPSLSLRWDTTGVFYAGLGPEFAVRAVDAVLCPAESAECKRAITGADMSQRPRMTGEQMLRIFPAVSNAEW